MSLRKTLVSAAIVAVAIVPFIFAQSGRMDVPAVQKTTDPNKKDQKEVFMRADKIYPIYRNDSMIMCFVGNFAAYHNGAVITCDSAVRYDERYFECYGNVLINKNTTYVYGERADYNGNSNEARVYSDLVKVVDGDASLYTYKFLFNTRTNIGRFSDGGVLVNRDNMLEADRGYYYADKRDIIGVDRVEMRNETYCMKGDSVIYNIATDKAYFFANSNIWNDKGDYLYADAGYYDKKSDLYALTLNGYILTEKQELWSDTLDYYKEEGHAILRSNLQLDDIEHKALAFGDYGEYWKEPGNVLLTRRPSVVSYDPQQGDTLFMRADSMFLFTLPVLDSAAMASDTMAVKTADDMATGGQTTDSLSSHPASEPRAKIDEGAKNKVDTTAVKTAADMSAERSDSVTMDKGEEKTVQTEEKELTKEERRAKLREAAEKEKLEKKKATAEAKKLQLAEIAKKRQAKTTAKLLAQKEKEEKQLAARKQRMETVLAKRKQKEREKAIRKGIPYVEEQQDSVIVNDIDSLTTMQDSLTEEHVDSLQADSLVIMADSVTPPADSIYRLIRAYRNVRIYRSDFQSVCDSLVAISTDSTIHLYIDPVLWNESNQVTSDIMDIFTANQEIVRAEFVGSPMMVSELDTIHYNQVSGKTMTAFFRKSQIYRNDVDGNAQTIYYMQEKGSSEIQNMMVIGSGSITFYIEDKAMDKISYKNNVSFDIYPMDQIPPEQELYLKGFKWQGNRRPDQQAVFDRTIRPSVREEKSALEQPMFPISAQINDDKRRLIESRRWADRNDQVMPDIIEWMRTRPE